MGKGKQTRVGARMDSKWMIRETEKVDLTTCPRKLITKGSEG